MDKQYKKSVDLWIESQELIIKELELKVDFTMRNIVINQKTLENATESLMHEIKQLNEFIKNKK